MDPNHPADVNGAYGSSVCHPVSRSSPTQTNKTVPSYLLSSVPGVTSSPFRSTANPASNAGHNTQATSSGNAAVSKVRNVELPIFNKFGHPSKYPPLNSSWYQDSDHVSQVHGINNGSTQFRPRYLLGNPETIEKASSWRPKEAAPFPIFRRNEALPLVPPPVPQGSPHVAQVNRFDTPFDSDTRETQSDKWHALLQVASSTAVATGPRASAPSNSSASTLLPPPKASKPAISFNPRTNPRPTAKQYLQPLASTNTVRSNRDERRKKQREAVQARRDVDESRISRPLAVAIRPISNGYQNESSMITKRANRRLQNRASVQKCRSKQRERLEDLADERDNLAVENPILARLKKDIEDSGILELVQSYIPEADEDIHPSASETHTEGSTGKVFQSRGVNGAPFVDHLFKQRNSTPLSSVPLVISNTATPRASSVTLGHNACNQFALSPLGHAQNLRSGADGVSFGRSALAHGQHVSSRPMMTNRSPTSVHDLFHYNACFEKAGGYQEQMRSPRAVLNRFLRSSNPVQTLPQVPALTQRGGQSFQDSHAENMSRGITHIRDDFDVTAQVRKRLRFDTSGENAKDAKRPEKDSM